MGAEPRTPTLFTGLKSAHGNRSCVSKTRFLKSGRYLPGRATACFLYHHGTIIIIMVIIMIIMMMIMMMMVP